MTKVALVSPPQSVSYADPPIGLALLAAVLQRQRYEVIIVDANALRLRPQEVTDLVKGVDAVGITAMTPTISSALNIVRCIKQSNSAMPVILGGAHATLLPDETLHSAPELDCVVRGEGEETIVEALRALEAGQPWKDISGVSYVTEGRVIHNPERLALVDMDGLPFPAYHLLPLDRYKPQPPHGRAYPVASMITSRGCPYRCSYCSKPVFGKKYRAMSVERVMEELLYYREEFRVREICFYDDVFTLDKKRTHALLEAMIQKDLRLTWTCETRVNLVDKDLLGLMKRAGCHSVSYGIESGAPEILETIHKDASLDQVEQSVRLTHEAGIQVVGYFMIGSPGETPATIRKTLDFAKKLRLDYAQFGIAIPFPGTELHAEYVRRYGSPNIPWENFDYEGLKKSLAPVFESEVLSREDLHTWSAQAYREFYLRPSYVWQRLRRMRSIGDLRVTLRGLFRLVKGIA